MDLSNWMEEMIGQRMPVSLTRLKWESFGGPPDTLSTDDMFDNIWFQESNEPESALSFNTELDSYHREYIHLPVRIYTDKDLIIKEIDIYDCYYADGVGRPEYGISLTPDEEDQIGNLIIALHKASEKILENKLSDAEKILQHYMENDIPYELYTLTLSIDDKGLHFERN
jgi:hypothetical protein